MSLVRNKLATCAGALGLVVTAVAAVSPQDVCNVVLPERLQSAGFIEKAERVSAILDELAERRRAFLATGANIELFPMLYYHTTFSEFENAVALPPSEADAVLDIIILFYAAYRHNRVLYDHRGAAAVEKHWRRYYRTASRKGTPRRFVSLLLDGVDAHLADLSRTLRYIFERMTLSKEALRTLYFALDATFEKVTQAAESDIRAVRTDPLMALESSFGLGSKYVIHARHRAWEAAVTKGRLRAKGPQPVMPHDARSRTFFSLKPDYGCSVGLLERRSRLF